MNLYERMYESADISFMIDDIWWYLPGTTATNVPSMSPVRAGWVQLDGISNARKNETTWDHAKPRCLQLIAET